MVISKSLGPVVAAVVVVVAAMVVVVVVCDVVEVVEADVVLVGVVVVRDVVEVVEADVVLVGVVVVVVVVLALVAGVVVVVVVVVVATDVVVASVVVAPGSTVDPLQATVNTSKKETVGRLIPPRYSLSQSCFDLPRDRWTRFTPVPQQETPARSRRRPIGACRPRTALLPPPNRVDGR